MTIVEINYYDMDTENKYGTLAIQRELLVLLKTVHNFCRSNGIHYSLAYGSLLGAVRHKGFIPWDDDLDIIVDRDNYQKILNAISITQELVIDRSPSSLWIDRLRRKTSVNKGQYSPTCDIFVLDDIPQNFFLERMKLYIIYMMQGMMKLELNVKKGSFLMKVCSIVTFVLGLPLSSELKKKWYISVSQWFNGKGKKKRCYNASFADIHCVFPENVLNKVQLVPFEDTEAFVMTEYDSFLKSRYGDYMTPPPRLEQIPKHL